MNEIRKMDDGGQMITLAGCEAKIALYKEQIGTGYIGIGKTLIEAKEAGVVPHGEWETWVEKTTGLSARQAQRCMQAAREIREGSEMAKLEMRKAIMLLSSGLDEETREAVAGEAAEKGTSIRALQEKIRQLQEEKDAEKKEAAEVTKKLKLQITEDAGTAAEIRSQLKRAQEERDALIGQMDAAKEAWRMQMDQEKEKAYRQGAKDNRAEVEKDVREDIRKEYEGKMDFLHGKNREQEEIIKDLNDQVGQARAEQTRAWNQGYKAKAEELEQIRREAMEVKNKEIDNLQEALDASEGELDEARKKVTEADEKIRKLEAELEAAEKREAKRAEQLRAMKEERAAADMESSRGGITASSARGADLGAAVRSFMGSAGVLPQMGASLAQMEESERRSIAECVETIAKWVTGAREALGMVAAEGGWVA